jgi:hypothetical protein
LGSLFLGGVSRSDVAYVQGVGRDRWARRVCGRPATPEWRAQRSRPCCYLKPLTSILVTPVFRGVWNAANLQSRPPSRKL